MKKEIKKVHRPYFTNPLFGGADPCVARDDEGYYHYVVARGDGIYLFRSRTLSDPGVPRRVYTFPLRSDGTPILQSVWAPEIHKIGGEWYIYFTASEEVACFETWHLRRMYVLHAVDVMGEFGDLSLLTLDEKMSIDGTVLQMPSGELYMVYMRNESPCRPKKEDPTAHHNKLYIAKMRDPMHIESAPTLLTEPEYDWEGDICEGPFPLVRNGKVFLLYSGNAAHLVDYCIGLLTCIDPENPMNKASWVKSPVPVFKEWGDVLGPGHASVVLSPDGSEHWLLYHSKEDRADTIPEGWKRVVNAKKIEWNEDGTPDFGVPPQFGERLRLPSGESDIWIEGGSVKGEAASLSEDLQCYASGVFGYSVNENSICVRHNTRNPTKLFFRRYEWTDATVTAEMVCDTDEYESGFAVRASYVALGHNRMDGYLALFHKGTVTVYRVDGDTRHALVSAPVELPKVAFCAGFRAEKDRLSVFVGEKEVCSCFDGTYSSGRTGFYCDADTEIRFVEVCSLND